MQGLVKWAFVTVHLLLVVLCIGAFIESLHDGSRRWTNWGYLALAACIIWYVFDRLRFGLRA
jgi:hypothetical protein